MTFIETIVSAWKAGYKIFYPTLAKVKLIKTYTPQTPGPETQRGIIQASTGPTGPDQPLLDGIELLAPGRPSVDARFVLLHLNNLDTRRVALGFTKYDEIKTVIGQASQADQLCSFHFFIQCNRMESG